MSKHALEGALMKLPCTAQGPRIYFLFLAVDKIFNLDTW